MRRSKTLMAGMFAGVLMVTLVGLDGPASAETKSFRVKANQLRDGIPSSPSAADANWYRNDTNLGGGVTITDEFGGTPDRGNTGTKSLGLTTNSLSSARAQLGTTHKVYGSLLTDITEIGYSTYHATESAGANDVAALQLQIFTSGTIGGAGFSTLVFVPEGILDEQWQTWDAFNTGSWYTTQALDCTGGYHADANEQLTIQAVASGCASTKVSAIGVDVGSGTPNFIVAADGIHWATAADSYTWFFGPK